MNSSECIFAVISAVKMKNKVKMKLGKYALEIWKGKIVKYLHCWLFLWYFRHIFVKDSNKCLENRKKGKLCV